MSRSSPAPRPYGPLVRFGLSLLFAALALFGSAEAQAQSLYDNLDYLRQNNIPPGIVNCRDRTIRILYAQEVEGLWNDFCCLQARLNGVIDGYWDSVLIDDWSKKIEPALYLLREQINYRARNPPPWLGVVELPEVRDVPQMYHFDKGIENFYISYVYVWGSPWIPQPKSIGSEQTKRATESHFVHSITYAAYEDEATAEAKAKEYLAADLTGKTKVVLDMKQRFQQMGKGDRGSKDPRDPYNRQLVASWSSFWLERSYYFEQKRTEGTLDFLIYDHIEVPLREYVGFKVRGPPHHKF